MSLHFPLPKIRTSCSFLPSHFPSLPSRRGHHGGAEIRNEFTLSIAKIFFALRLCSPSFKWHEPRDEWSKAQNKWSNPALSYFSSHRKTESNQYQKLLEIEKEIVREVARSDKPYLRKSTDRKAQIRKALVQFSGLICALRSVDFLR